MKRILVIEDEYYDIENSFNMMNVRYYHDTLAIDIKKTYQDVLPLDDLNDYDLIVLDISLGNKSNKDGFALLEDIKNYDVDLFFKILIISGSDYVRSKLDTLGYEGIPSLLKPLDYILLHNKIKNIL